MSDLQAQADFYMDQYLADFSEISLGLGADVTNPEKVIEAIKKVYAEKGKELKPFN